MTTLGWISVALFVMVLEFWFIYLYFKEGDKRKLLFAVGFCTSFITFLILSLQSYGFNLDITLKNFYQWSSIPIMISVAIAANETVFKIKNFDKVFKIYLSIYFISFFVITFNPILISEYLSFFRQGLGAEILFISIFSFIKKREFDSLMFLLALISLIAAGVSLSRNLIYLSIFSYFIGFTFLSLIFATPYLSLEREGVGSYFVLKKKLENVTDSLQESQKKYRAIVENTNDAIIVSRSNGVSTYASPSCKEIFGYTQEEMTGCKKWPIEVVSEDKDKVKAMMERGFQGEPGSDLEYRVRTKNGNVKWISHSWIPVKKNGKINRLVSTIRDITNQKELEIELKNKVEKLRKNELATLNIMEDYQENIKSLEKAQSQIKAKNDELRLANKELEEAREKLTELNENLERKVEERTKQVRKLLKQKEGFINQLGHDLKTPLTPLNTLLPIMKDRVEDEKDRELIETMIQNVNHMKNLVTKTLKLARLNSPSKTLEIENTNISSEVEKIIQRKDVMFNKRNIEIENLIDNNIEIPADKTYLDEVFENLIDNAVKYSPEGGKITVDAVEEPDDTLKVVIEDEGMGMTKEQLEKIFDEFYKADKSRHDFESSGLGLPICKKIVEQHGGEIWAESPGKNKGSKIYFTLKTTKDS
ncbi:MAG: ATP-binding protein [Candidatus Thermoplasmatota archaeon]